jgi:hypothetical protein
VAERLGRHRLLPLNAERRKHCIAALREHPLAWWTQCFQKVPRSRFLRGESGRDSWNGATFDWLVKHRTNALKVLEGSYDDPDPPPSVGVVNLAEELRRKDEERVRGKAR